MRVDCYQCSAVYEIPDAALGPGGVRAECPRCSHQQTVRRDEGREAEPSADVGPDDRDDLFDFSGAGGATAPPPLPPKGPAGGAGPVPPKASVAASPAAGAAPAAKTLDPFDDDDPFADIPDEPVEDPIDDLLDEIAKPSKPAGAAIPGPVDGGAPRSSPGASRRDDLLTDPAAGPSGAEDRLTDPAPASELPSAGADLDDPFATFDPPPRPPPPASVTSVVTGPARALPDPAAATDPGSPPADAGEAKPLGDDDYRIKKPDGRILGPFPLATLETMAEKGEVAPGDQVARGTDEFRLLSQYEECAPLLEKYARRHRVQTGKPVFREAPKRRWPKVLAAVLVAVIGGSAGIWRLAPDLVPDPVREGVTGVLARLTDGGEEPVENPVRQDLGLYRLQVVDLEGTAREHLVRAEALMAEDLPGSYDAADLALKRALLLDPDDPSVIGRFLVNVAFLNRWSAEAGDLQRWLGYARYLEEVAPDHPAALQGRAAVQLLLGSRNAAEARRIARAAVDAAPDDPFGRLVLGRATAGVDHQAAIAKLSEWAARPDAPVRIHLEQAHACRLAGDFACADAALRARLELSPDHEEAIAELVALHVLVGGYAEAKTLYESLLERDEGRADAALSLAILEYQLGGDTRRARQRVEAALAQRVAHSGDILDRRLRLHGAILARLEGADRRARDLLAEIFEHDPHDGPASYQAVLLALSAGDVDEAAARLPAAVATIDHPSRRAMLRALVHAARDNLDDAVREARRAMEARPDAIEPVLFAASLEGRRGQPRQAYLLLRQSLGRDPTEVRQHRSLTEYWDGRELDRAIRTGFEALVERDPRQGMAHAAQGAGAWLAGDARAARAALRRALALDEQNFPAHVFLGIVTFEAGSHGAAATSFAEAARIDGLSPLPRYLEGRVAEARGERDEAVVAYRDALRRDGAFHPAQVRLAVLEAPRQPERSRETVRRVAASRPDNVAARAALFEIGR